jgi:hypothetical protein
MLIVYLQAEMAENETIVGLPVFQLEGCRNL